MIDLWRNDSLPQPRTRLATVFEILPITPDIVSEIVGIHREAFAGYMNTRLGDGYIKSFIEWFLQADQSTNFVAIDETRNPVGYVVGAPFGWDKKMNRDLFWVAAGRTLIRPWLLFDSQFRRTIGDRLGMMVGTGSELPQPVLPEPIMSLVGIGVSSSARGKKCGVALMNAFEDRARQLKMRAMNLSVYPSNFVARRLYEECAWRPFVIPARQNESMFYTKILNQRPALNVTSVKR